MYAISAILVDTQQSFFFNNPAFFILWSLYSQSIFHCQRCSYRRLLFKFWKKTITLRFEPPFTLRLRGEVCCSVNLRLIGKPGSCRPYHGPCLLSQHGAATDYNYNGSTIAYCLQEADMVSFWFVACSGIIVSGGRYGRSYHVVYCRRTLNFCRS